jgi:hypothetical protein
MGFFKKEENKELGPDFIDMPKLPELPELPSDEIMPSMNEFQSPQNNFQSYPQSGAIPIEALKSEIRSNAPRIPPPRQEIRTREVDSIPMNNSFSETRTPIMPPVKETLYIKIDKFQEAVERFAEIRKKLSVMEDNLRRIKEIKQKETEELRAWEEEMNSIKNRIGIIDNSLFSKI